MGEEECEKKGLLENRGIQRQHWPLQETFPQIPPEQSSVPSQERERWRQVLRKLRETVHSSGGVHAAKDVDDVDDTEEEDDGENGGGKKREGGVGTVTKEIVEKDDEENGGGEEEEDVHGSTYIVSDV